MYTYIDSTPDVTCRSTGTKYCKMGRD